MQNSVSAEVVEMVAPCIECGEDTGYQGVELCADCRAVKDGQVNAILEQRIRDLGFESVEEFAEFKKFENLPPTLSIDTIEHFYNQAIARFS